MPSRINRVPQGLLSFLDLKAQGRAPDTFPDVLQPVIDLSDFYLQDRLRAGTEIRSLAAGTAGAVVTAAQMLVPNEQTLWLVLGYSVSTTTGAGDTSTFQPYLQRYILGGYTTYEYGDRLVLGNSDSGGTSIIRPFWYRYNDLLGAIRKQTSAGNLSYTFSLTYVSFSI